MDLTETFRRLSYGALSNLAISDEGSGTIIPAKQSGIIDHINDALLRLHSRFLLIEHEVILQQIETITRYRISSKHATSNLDINPGTAVFILDSESNPYKDDLLKILSVYNEQGCVLPLNDAEHCESLFTPQPNVLQIPVPIQDRKSFIMYQARHPLVTDTAPNIDIPDSLEDALLSYVAHKVFFHMNGQEHTAKAAEHLAIYERICSEVTTKDLVNSSISTSNIKFTNRGFV